MKRSPGPSAVVTSTFLTPPLILICVYCVNLCPISLCSMPVEKTMAKGLMPPLILICVYLRESVSYFSAFHACPNARDGGAEGVEFVQQVLSYVGIHE